MTALLAVLPLGILGCDQDDSIDDNSRTTPQAEAQPEPPSEHWPQPSCDAAPLEGRRCQCGDLKFELITFDGEIVADGERAMSLHRGGTGIGAGFGTCGDKYVWEDAGPACALVVTYADRGCLGLTLSDIVGHHEPCPYVQSSGVCTFADG